MALQYSITAVGAVILQSAVNTFRFSKSCCYCCCPKIIDVLYTTNGYDGFYNGYLLWTKFRCWKDRAYFKGIKESMLLVIGYGIVACIFMIFFENTFHYYLLASNETSVINDAQQFLICNSIFYFVLGILFVSETPIQGLGKSALTMLAGVLN